MLCTIEGWDRREPCKRPIPNLAKNLLSSIPDLLHTTGSMSNSINAKITIPSDEMSIDQPLTTCRAIFFLPTSLLIHHTSHLETIFLRHCFWFYLSNCPSWGLMGIALQENWNSSDTAPAWTQSFQDFEKTDSQYSMLLLPIMEA